MKLRSFVVLFACLIANAALAGEKISSLTAAGYDYHDKPMLPHAFITAVNSWLRKYEPHLVSKDGSHVTMRVNYSYLYDVELYVTSGEYQILVTLAQDAVLKSKAKGTADKLSAGVLKAMKKSLARARKVRDGR